MESYVLRVGRFGSDDQRLRGEVRLVRSGRTVLFHSADELISIVEEDLDDDNGGSPPTVMPTPDA